MRIMLTKAKSVLFFYDNGSRGRQVLTDFLGSAEIVALQSDGYNAYTFLDNELTDIEHMMTVERKRSSFAGLLPTGRKNSLMFGSHKGAEMSAIFHTFIETCKINGISTIEYFKKLLSELLTGNNKTRTLFAHSVGFENASLLPQTIGIKR